MHQLIGLFINLIVLIQILESFTQNYENEGTLVFSEDFNGTSLRNYYWESEEGCEEVRHENMYKDCFLYNTNNLEVKNGTLVLRAGMIQYEKDQVLYTTGRIRGSGFGFTYGTYLIRARLPKGISLYPSFYLLPLNTHLDKCKYEEINIMDYSGSRLSTIYFSAKYGKSYENIYTRTVSKVFGHHTDFSSDFHTFGLKWYPTRLEWYVDDVKVQEMNTHFISDWTIGSGKNLPCSKNKKPFGQKSNLFISLNVNGRYFPGRKKDQLTLKDAKRWIKPTMEIDWIRIYSLDTNLNGNSEKGTSRYNFKPFAKRNGVPSSQIGPISTGYL